MGGSGIYEGDSPLEKSPLALFIVQMLIVVIVSKLISALCKLIKQPSVIAEVVTGILLGPSVMGLVPGFTDNIFPPSSIPTFKVIAYLGLILFMFLIGLELDLSIMQSNFKGSTFISATAMVVPFGLGVGAAGYFYHQLTMAPGATFVTFMLFVGVAVSVTAFPVLARILTNQNLTRSKVGVIALSSAAIDDVVAWLLLAVVVSIAGSSGLIVALYTLLAFAAYVLVVLIVVRPILARLSETVNTYNSMKHEFVILILALLFISAWITDMIGVHSMFGGFLLGVITPRDHLVALRITERVEELIMIILLPLYFTYLGLKTDLSTVDSYQAGVSVALIIAASMVGKIGGAAVASRVLRNTWRESFTIGFLLNTKGLVELVVLNVGLDIGVLTNQVFAIFMIMALWNTFLTTPAVWLLWTRLEKKDSPKTSKRSGYSVLVCIQEARAGVSMVTVAGALVKAHAKGANSRRKPFVKAIHLKEVSERPSTYFFALRLDKSDVVEFARQRALMLGVNFKVTARASADLPADLIKIANARVRDLVVIGWNRHQMTDRVHEGGRRVHQLMLHIRAPIGVLVDKGRLSDRTNVERVLFVYSFHEFERAAVKVALELARDPDVRVTIIVPRQEPGWPSDDVAGDATNVDLNLPAARQRAESDNTATTSTSDDDDSAIAPAARGHSIGSASDGSGEPAAATPAKSKAKKGRAWYEYFDVLVLLSLLVSLLRLILQRTMRRRSHDGGGRSHSASRRGGRTGGMSSSQVLAKPIERDIEMQPPASDQAVLAHDTLHQSSPTPRKDADESSPSPVADHQGAAGVASAMLAEQKRAEEQLMESFEGVQALVASKPNVSLVVSQSEDVLEEALEQEAKHVYQMIVIGNERKWSRAHQHVHHHLNIHRHHRPHIRFGGSLRRRPRDDDDGEDGDIASDSDVEDDSDDESVDFSDLVGSSTTSLLVVHPPLDPAAADERVERTLLARWRTCVT